MSARTAQRAPLAGYVPGDDLEGFSLKGIFKAVKKVASPIQKAAASVGHAVGSAVTSKVGQGILGGALALTGVGAAPAALIFGATKGVGNLIKPGGNLKHFATGALQGAAEGVASNLAGKTVRAVKNEVTGALAKRAATSTASAAGNVAATAVTPSQQAAVDAIAAQPLPGVQVTPVAQLPPVITSPGVTYVGNGGDSPPIIVQAPQVAQLPPDTSGLAQALQTVSQASADNSGATVLDTAGQVLQRVAGDSSTPDTASQFSSDANAGDTSNSSDSFASIADQQAQANEIAAAQAAADAAAAANKKKLIIMGGIGAGALGVAVLARHRKKGGRR